MVISSIKFSECKWWDQIFADSIKTQMNNYVQDGTKWVLSTRFQETTTSIMPEIKNPINSGKSC